MAKLQRKRRVFHHVSSVSRLHKRIARTKLFERTPYLPLVITLGVFVLALIVIPALRWWPQTMRSRDLEGIAPRQQFGVVTRVTFRGADSAWGVVPPEVLVRFDGGEHRAETLMPLSKLQIGKPMWITYRIGKSGQVYIDKVGR